MSEPSSTERDRIEKLADSFITAYRAGQRPSIDVYVDQYPELAGELRELIAALLLLERNSPRLPRASVPHQAPHVRAPREIGEFTIIREIGRGGMGVVYEAVQQSLGRHVALKVLSSPDLINPTHLERFRLEARSAGRLHHSHIVPVYGVGEHEGTHYYAMQFIPGQSLDEVIHALRKLHPARGEQPTASPRAEDLTESIAGGILTGRFADGAGEMSADSTVADAASRRATRTATKRLPTSSGQFSSGSLGKPFYESVARVGLQVAEALAYAHSEGILHRDIKPSNLLLDAKGNTWITDFGLVKADDSQSLTETGDVVGTLRYMAPERLEGWSDRRSDIYALGATLYELLTLRTFLECSHRAQLIDSIHNKQPVAPTSIDRGVPRDLETIVLKALAKEPASRYHSADEMAEDLQRFLADSPILARRSTRRERLVRWCRRNPLPTVLAATAIIALVAGTIASLWQANRAMRAERDSAVRQAALSQRVLSILDRARDQVDREDGAGALANAELAEKLLSDAREAHELNGRTRDLRADAELLQRFEQIRLIDDRSDDIFEVSVEMHRGFEREFGSLSIDIDKLSIEEAAMRVRQHRIAFQICQLLDDWYHLRRNIVLQAGRDGWNKPDEWWQRPLTVARSADHDEYCNRVRLAAERSDLAAQVALARSPNAVRLPGHTFTIMARQLDESRDEQNQTLALDLRRRAFLERPDDFNLSSSLSSSLQVGPAKDNNEVIRYATAALALRRQSARARLMLGVALSEAGRRMEAEQVYRQGMQIEPNYLLANRLGQLLYQDGKFKASEEMFRRTIELRPDHARGHGNLGSALAQQSKLDEAIAAFRKALELKPGLLQPHLSLIYVLLEKRQIAEALELYQELSAQDPCTGQDYMNLGAAFASVGVYDVAVVASGKALELGWNNELAQYFHALLQLRNGDMRGYRASCAEILRIYGSTDKPNISFVVAWACGIGPDSVADYAAPLAMARRALDADAEDPSYLTALGILHYRAGQLEQAAKELAEANAGYVKRPATGGVVTIPRMYLAMTHQRLGDEAAALHWLFKASDSARTRPDKSLFWSDRAVLELAREEIEQLLPGNSSSQITE